MGAPYGRRRDALSLSSYEFSSLFSPRFFGSEVSSTQLQAEMECRATKRSPRACASKRSTHPFSETYHGAQAACRTPLPRQAWVHPKCTPCKPRFKVLKFMGKSSPRPSNSIAAVPESHFGRVTGWEGLPCVEFVFAAFPELAFMAFSATSVLRLATVLLRLPELLLLPAGTCRGGKSSRT